MFEKLGNAFSKAAKSFSEKDLNEKDIEDVLSELEISLLESDVATEVIDSIKSDLGEKLVGSRVNKKEIEDFVQKSLIENISNMFDEAGSVDILSGIKSKTDPQDPYLILFVGINGTGKTTTVAKMANLLQKNKISVVVAAADTFRAGAIEQLREHINNLNLKLIAQNYGSDPAAVAHDALLYAKSHKVDCVLIDSAGRMQTNKNLMEQIEKITKVVNPDLKIFVGDSLAGNDTVSQAREFHEHTTFDGAILTKSDADARGGAALSIVAVTKKPVICVGTGQGYDDLELFSKEAFLERVFGKPEPTPEPVAEPEPTPEPVAEPEPTPEPVAEGNSHLFAVRTTGGQEKIVMRLLEARLKMNKINIHSVLLLSDLKGYVVVEAENASSMFEAIQGIRHVRGQLRGELTYNEIDKYLIKKSTVSELAVENTVEIIAGPFKGMKATITRIDQEKEEATVVLLDATYQLPVTVDANYLKLAAT